MYDDKLLNFLFVCFKYSTCNYKSGLPQIVKNLPEMQETRVQSLGWEEPLEKGMATHSNILAWRIPWSEEWVSYSLWGHKKSDTIE